MAKKARSAGARPPGVVAAMPHEGAGANWTRGFVREDAGVELAGQRRPPGRSQAQLGARGKFKTTFR